MDTTSTTMTFCLYHVYANPAVKERLWKELDEAFPDLSQPITYKKCESLPYLTAVIKETLRMYSASPAVLPRVVPPGGLSIGDKFFLPAGTEVGAQAYSMHRKPEIYGNDCLVWRPERWLDVDAEQLKMMTKAFVPFSIGEHITKTQKDHAQNLT